MNIMYIIILLITIGYLLKAFKILKEEDRIVLNRVVVYVAMPATIFLTILGNVSVNDLTKYVQFPILIFISFSVCGGFGYIVGKFLKLKKQSLGGLILVCALANTGFLGYPIVLGYYGPEGLSRAIFCDIGGVITSLLFGTYIGIIYGKNPKSKEHLFKKVVFEVFKFPPLLSALFSIMLIILGISLTEIPEYIALSLKYISNATVPLIMISLGLSLSPSSTKFGVKYGLIASFSRFIISPLIMLFLVSILSIDGLDKSALIMEATMPTAMMSLVFALLYELDIKLVASACFITTILSFIVIPIIAIII